MALNVNTKCYPIKAVFISIQKSVLMTKIDLLQLPPRNGLNKLKQFYSEHFAKTEQVDKWT